MVDSVMPNESLRSIEEMPSKRVAKVIIISPFFSSVIYFNLRFFLFVTRSETRSTIAISQAERGQPRIPIRLRFDCAFKIVEERCMQVF